ncbi:MAG: TolC family protein [Desulfomonile tiedjei]|nr:TolC family protein [Desulfomonile tiedjei]
MMRAAGNPFSFRKVPIRYRGANNPHACLMVLGMVACALLWAIPATAGPEIKPASYGYFDFPTCVRYALVHSESFVKNRLEIQIKSIDVKDAHADILPTITVLSRYYFARATGDITSNPVNVSLYMTNWNPYLALIKMKASSILVDGAKLTHLDKINQNVGEMAKLFYRIHILERLIRANKQIEALERDKVDYGKSRAEQGAIDPLELQIWQNKLKGQRIKVSELRNEIDEKVTQLKALMGYHPDFHLPLDTRDAANQVLSGFNGRYVTFADVQGANLGLKILAKNEQFQSNNVTAAYLALLPKPGLVLENINNQVDRTSGFNFGLGLDYTLWDGFTRVRDIRRQKMKAQQIKSERELLSQKLYGNFKQLRGNLTLSGEKESYNREQAKLAELSEEKAFISYKGGSLSYEEYVEKRIGKVEASLSVVSGSQDRVFSLIELATVAGGLNRYNARIRH